MSHKSGKKIWTAYISGKLSSFPIRWGPSEKRDVYFKRHKTSLGKVTFRDDSTKISKIKMTSLRMVEKSNTVTKYQPYSVGVIPGKWPFSDDQNVKLYHDVTFFSWGFLKTFWRFHVTAEFCNGAEFFKKLMAILKTYIVSLNFNLKFFQNQKGRCNETHKHPIC